MSGFFMSQTVSASANVAKQQSSCNFWMNDEKFTEFGVLPVLGSQDLGQKAMNTKWKSELRIEELTHSFVFKY